jgi:hypothetical protein
MSEQPARYNFDPVLRDAKGNAIGKVVGGESRAIPTVLSGEQWLSVTAIKGDAHHCHQTIALANHALPDDDPRKITRVGLSALRADAEELRKRSSNGDDALFLIAWRMTLMADALESYLPPA